MVSKEARDAKNIAWKLYKAARSIFFGDAESNKLSKACNKLRRIADSGKLSAEHSGDLTRLVGKIEKDGPNPETKGDLENWYMQNHGESLMIAVQGHQILLIMISIGVALVMLQLSLSVLEMHDTSRETIIITAIASIVFTIISIWLFAKIMFRKPKQLLFKHYGKDCLSKKK